MSLSFIILKGGIFFERKSFKNMSADMEMRELTIKNKLGLHARAAALLVKTTNAFASEVVLEKDRQRVNGKSIMGVMMLAAAKGSTLKVEAEGPDALEVVSQVEALVNDLFGEGE